MIVEHPHAVVAILLVPLVVADHRSLSVPAWWLATFFLTSLAVSFIDSPSNFPYQLWGASAVIAGGALVYLLVSGRLGEADIVTAAALALVSGFWDFLTSVMLACLGAFLFMVWTTLRNKTFSNAPMPFLPSLAWGWISVQLANGNMIS